MAIKKRERPAIDSAAIDSFGDAADALPPVTEPAEPVDLPAVAQRSAESARTSRKVAADLPPDWPTGMSKTFLVRFPDPTLPLAVAELQDLISRNKHQTVILALRRGIDVLRAEAEELGDRADLIK